MQFRDASMIEHATFAMPFLIRVNHLSCRLDVTLVLTIQRYSPETLSRRRSYLPAHSECRGWLGDSHYNHQHVSLELHFGGIISGHTRVTITPNDPNLRTVYLHARELYIRSVILEEQHLTFSHSDPLVPSSRNSTFIPSQQDSVKHAYPELKRKFYAATSEADEGELAILLPEQSVREVSRQSPPTDTSETNTLAANGPAKVREFEPITLTIHYEVRGSGHGIRFNGLDDPTDRVPHIFTTGDSQRCWVPCVDDIWERCTWELDFVVPHAMSFEEEPTAEGNQESIGSFPVSVVASGDLQERISHPSNSDQVIFSYMQSIPASVRHIGFAAGPFEMIELSPSRQVDNPDEDEEIFEDTDQPSVRAFCLAGRQSELVNSVSFVRKAMEFFVSEYGSYPFGSYKLAFVDEPIASSFNTAALSIYSSDLLFPSTVLEQVYETRHIVSHGLASQWVGVNIIQRSWADTWLVNGLSLYISSMFLRDLMGNNEYLLRLKKDMLRCCALDVRMPPLCQPGLPHPLSADLVSFVNLKAPLVLHILDRQLLKSGLSMGLSRVIPKIFISSISGDLRDNLLSTSNFLRTCRKVSGGADVRLFAEQWVFSNGCPRFSIKANFNRKKMAVELSINQDSPAFTYANSKDPTYVANLKPVQLFEGTMTIRIHEADGTPYEHVLDIKDQYKRHDVPFNTKYKRVRRNTKRFQMRQAAAVAAAQGDTEAAEDLGLVDMGFSLKTWEQEEEREKWRVADWTEEDDQIMSQATYEWIRIDAELDWICTTSFEQPDYMWISQLQRDRDVVAQLDAVQALGKMPSAVVSSNLTKTVLVDSYFYRIRTEAALMLTTCASQNLDYIGLFHLFKLFKSRYCFNPDESVQDAFSFNCVPRSNDFSDIAEYFVEKAIITAISSVRDHRGSTWPKIQQFLIELLTFNDNSRNPYSDSYYIALIINSLANSLINFAPVEASEFMSKKGAMGKSSNPTVQLAMDEIDRYMSMDRLVSSYRNAISQAGLDAKAKLMMASELPVDAKAFLPYTRDGNFIDVRITAFNCLILLCGFNHPLLLNYFFSVLRYDSSISLRRRLALSLVESFPILVAVEDYAAASSAKGFIEDESEKRAIKSDTLNPAKVQKALRREVGRTLGLRDLLMAALLAPDLDIDVRWSILKLCEILVKPGAEPLPKIKIPSTFLNTVGPRIDAGTVGTENTNGAVDVPGPLREQSPEQPLRLSLISNQNKDKSKKAKETKQVKPTMLMQESISCKRVQKKVWASDTHGLFHTAVDPVKHNAPHYYDIIKNPMDLSIMSYKLDNNVYETLEGYRDDFKLMISNAKTYNRPGQFAYKVAEKVDTVFDREWNKILKSLAKLEERTAAKADNNKPSGTGTMKLSLGLGNKKESPVSGTPGDKQQSSSVGSVSLKLKNPEAKKSNAKSSTPVKAAKVEPKQKKTKADGSTPRSILKMKSNTAQEISQKRLQIADTVQVRENDHVDDDSKKANKKKDFHSSAGEPGVAPEPPQIPESPEMERFRYAPLDVQRARNVLKSMTQSPFAYWFKEPVNPDFAPGYYEEIKQPMDLKTMSQKLDNGSYETYDDFFRDFNLILSNCRVFNPSTQEPTIHSYKLEVSWVQAWKKALKLNNEEKSALKKIHEAVWNHPNAVLFHYPVDPNTTTPYYWDVIPQEQARDLSMIRTKLNAGKYETVDNYEEDMKLMFNNARLFNGPQSEVATVWTPPLEETLEKEMGKYRAGMGTKRRGGGGGGDDDETSKKVKKARMA